MSSIVQESVPANEPVSVDLAKQHLRITTSEEDDLIELYLFAAREDLENDTNRSFIIKSYRQTHDGFPTRSLDYVTSQRADYGPIRYWNRLPNYSQEIKLLRSPLRQIMRISYLSLDDSAWHDLFPTPLSWLAKTIYSLGDQVVDPNGNLQEVTAVAHTGADDTDDENESGAGPTWNATPTLTTVDADLTWTNKGTAPAGDFIYDRDSEPPRVFPLAGESWPAVMSVPNCVVIHFEAGYGDDEDSVPARARVAILQITGNWYENRESVTAAELKKIPAQFDALVWSLKVQDFAPTPG